MYEEWDMIYYSLMPYLFVKHTNSKKTPTNYY